MPLPFGQNKLGIVFIKEMPSAAEQQNGKFFSDRVGVEYIQRLTRHISGFNFERDCYVTSILLERPANGKFKLNKETKTRVAFLEQELLKLKPSIIFGCGSYAIKLALPGCPPKVSDFKMHGRAIPSLHYGCMTGCLLGDAESYNYISVCLQDMDKVLYAYMNPDERITSFDFDNGNHLISTEVEFDNLCEKLQKENKPICFDFETSGLNPYSKDAKIYSVAITNTRKEGWMLPLDYKNFWTPPSLAYVTEKLKGLLIGNLPKIIQNAEFESIWSRQILGVTVNNILYDTMVGYHVIDERNEICKLDFQEFELFGKSHKTKFDVKHILDSDITSLCKYNVLDARVTYLIYELRNEFIEKNKWPKKPTAFFMDALQMLIRMKLSGIKIDKKELDKQLDNSNKMIETLTAELYDSDVAKQFKIENTRDLSLGSTKDLRQLFYKQLKITPTKLTSSEIASVDAETLESFGINESITGEAKPFIEKLLLLRQYTKLTNTYLLPYSKSLEFDGKIHPTCALHTTRTYRSSYFNPNLQNIPSVKAAGLGKDVRKVFVPSLDWFLDFDCSAAEVRVLAMYSKDERLTKEAVNNMDIHRYWASRVYQKREQEVTSSERSNVKSNFVFALIYGGSSTTSAKTLKLDLKHIQEVEKELWAAYPGVLRWMQSWTGYWDEKRKKRVYGKYNKLLYVEHMAGFRRHGPLKSRHIINTPIQGSSFHLLLNGIMSSDAEMIANNMKSYPVLQVHDEGLFDCVENEMEQVIDIVTRNLRFSKRFENFMGKIPMEIEWSYGKNYGELTKI